MTEQTLRAALQELIDAIDFQCDPLSGDASDAEWEQWQAASDSRYEEALKAARFAALNEPPASQPSREVFKARWHWYSDSEGQWEVYEAPSFGSLPEGHEVTLYAASQPIAAAQEPEHG